MKPHTLATARSGELSGKRPHRTSSHDGLPLLRATREELRLLAESDFRPCISVIVPAPGAQDGDRAAGWSDALSRCLDRADASTRSLCSDEEDSNRLLTGARSFARSRRVAATLEHANPRAIALYAARDLFKTFHLACAEKGLVVVGDRFFLKPLVCTLRFDARFYALQLTAESVRLLEVTRVGTVPMSLLLASSRDFEPASEAGEDGEEFHLAVRPRGGQPAARMKRLADALRHLLRTDRVPLVVVGPADLQRSFRQHYRDPYLVEEPIIEPGGAAGDARILEEGWKHVEPWLQRNLELACRRFRMLRDSGRTTDDAAVTLRKARDGAVDTVFAREAAFSAVDFTEKEVILEEALCHEGEVYVVRDGDFPGSPDATVAAVFR